MNTEQLLKRSYTFGSRWGRPANLGHPPQPVVSAAVEYAFRYHLGLSAHERLSIEVESMNIAANTDGTHAVRFIAEWQCGPSSPAKTQKVLFTGRFDDGVVELRASSVD